MFAYNQVEQFSLLTLGCGICWRVIEHTGAASPQDLFCKQVPRLVRGNHSILIPAPTKPYLLKEHVPGAKLKGQSSVDHAGFSTPLFGHHVQDMLLHWWYAAQRAGGVLLLLWRAARAFWTGMVCPHLSLKEWPSLKRSCQSVPRVLASQAGPPSITSGCTSSR